MRPNYEQGGNSTDSGQRRDTVGPGDLLESALGALILGRVIWLVFGVVERGRGGGRCGLPGRAAG